MSPPRIPPGFTLIELLVAMAIAAIMLTLAIPSFQDFILRSRLTSHANDLVLAMAYAKSEALKRGTSVQVCASSNATTCTGNWEDGWIVITAGNEVLQVRDGFQDTICADANTINFRNTGYPVAGIVFDLYNSQGVAEGRRITVSLQGRATTTQPATACP
jgi:type IV fimbrial biogenesis protein FimT